MNQENTNTLENSNLESHNINDLNKNKKSKLSIPVIIVGVLIALLIVGGGIYFISKNNAIQDRINPTNGGNLTPEPGEEQIQNPITGELSLLSQAEGWVNNRPLAVMVNNHVDARPQSGLTEADIVYEVVAEGGITRYLAFFLSNVPEKIGPVRSARDYYLVLVKELGDAMIMHEGWSPQALEAIETWPVRSLQRGGASALSNWRDNPRGVAVEHTLYTNGKVAYDYGVEQLGWEGNREFRNWQFKDDDSPVNETAECRVGECEPITIDFWFVGDYSAIWDYNRETNSYFRNLGYDFEGNPIPHVDQETGEQIEVKNLIVQFAQESGIAGDAKNRLEYQLTGSNSALIFVDGTVTEATWLKESRDGRTLYYDLDGNEIQFNRGKIWISIVPDRNAEQVNY